MFTLPCWCRCSVVVVVVVVFFQPATQTQTHIDTNKPKVKPTYIVLRLSHLGSGSEVGWSAHWPANSGGLTLPRARGCPPRVGPRSFVQADSAIVGSHDRNSCKAQAEWRPIPPGAQANPPRCSTSCERTTRVTSRRPCGYRLLTSRREVSQQSVPYATNTWQPAKRVPALG